MRLAVFRSRKFWALPIKMGAHNSKGERLIVIPWLWWIFRLNLGRDRRYDFR